jgi:SulP family sulfate permease
MPPHGTNNPSHQPDRGLRPDLVAGLTAAAVVLPKAIA